MKGGLVWVGLRGFCNGWMGFGILPFLLLPPLIFFFFGPVACDTQQTAVLIPSTFDQVLHRIGF
jgi:hypothetical protein